MRQKRAKALRRLAVSLSLRAFLTIQDHPGKSLRYSAGTYRKVYQDLKSGRLPIPASLNVHEVGTQGNLVTPLFPLASQTTQQRQTAVPTATWQTAARSSIL